MLGALALPVAAAAGLVLAKSVGHRNHVSSNSLLTHMLASSSEANRNVGRALAA